MGPSGNAHGGMNPLAVADDLVKWRRGFGLVAIGGRVPEDSVMVSIAENGLNLGEGLRPFVRRQPRPNYRAMPCGGVLAFRSWRRWLS